MRKNTGFFLLILILILASCAPGRVPPRSEFRGIWVASVRNIDWPSSAGLSRNEILGEFHQLAEFYEAHNFNAMVVQVRPAADAFYRSELEPWSEWYSGKQGKGLPYDEDLLPILIDEAHEHGMEFHAWFNPYRGVIDIDSAVVDSLHASVQHPDWFVRYGDNLYFDPGVPEAQDHVVNVIADVVSRYDIDAVHFDDYFYPYRIDTLRFPDSLSYAQYGRDYEHVDDWRRNNVDVLVKALSDTIKAIKPWVKFGISPFGVWRNKSDDPRGSATRAGQTNYDDLYADVLKWQREGWLDYIVPQIYWEIGFELADYEVLTDWWSDHDYGRHIYIGQASYRIPRWKRTSEMGDHLRMAASYPEIRGNVFFNARSLLENPKGFSDSLRRDHYRRPALVPAMPWIDSEAPEAPDTILVRSDREGLFLEWEPVGTKDIREYAVYRVKGRWKGDFPGNAELISRVRHPSFIFRDTGVRNLRKYSYVITAVDRLGNESEPTLPVMIRYKR